MIAMTVTDTGVGLEQATLNRIFEPYFSTKISGTGLGMAIAKRNIELNGGTVAVTSEKDRGTTVTLKFPVGEMTAVLMPPYDADRFWLGAASAATRACRQRSLDTAMPVGPESR